MAKYIKVLEINYDSNPYNGVVVFLMNVYRHIDHEKFHIDFLTPNKSSYYPYEQEIIQDGGKVYAFHINCDSLYGKLWYGRKLYAFLNNHSYDIVHINSAAVSFDCISAIVAKSRGGKVIIHSHNAGGRNSWKVPFAYLMKLLMQKQADVLCACSKEAAMNTFTAKKVNHGDVIIIKNGIDLQKFKYKKGIRDKVRKKLNLEGHFVIGHVGRFEEQKNHEFLIDIFAEILRREQSAILLLVGQGNLEPGIRKKVQNLHIENSVIFLGSRDDVEDLYQAMDIFLFPSIFEGLGIALIEAQMSGLPCFISDTITKEVDLTELIHRLSLHSSPQKWANKILSSSGNPCKRCSHEQELRSSGYAIENTAMKISHIYQDLM